MLLDVLGPHSIPPFLGFGQQMFKLGSFISIGLKHYAKKFPCLIWVEPWNDSSFSARGVLGKGQVSRGFLLGDILPAIAIPVEVNKVPVGLVKGNSSTCSS